MLLEPTLGQLPLALQQPELHGLLRHHPELEHCAHLHPDARETLLLWLPVPAGHGLQFGEKTSARPTWTSRGGVAKLRFGAFGGSIPGLVQQSEGTLEPADQGHCLQKKSVSVTDSLALMGSATLDGLTAQGNVSAQAHRGEGAASQAHLCGRVL